MMMMMVNDRKLRCNMKALSTWSSSVMGDGLVLEVTIAVVL
jgi:hypothetical protein